MVKNDWFGYDSILNPNFSQNQFLLDVQNTVFTEKEKKRY